jgi:hypothetical protein
MKRNKEFNKGYSIKELKLSNGNNLSWNNLQVNNNNQNYLSDYKNLKMKNYSENIYFNKNNMSLPKRVSYDNIDNINELKLNNNFQKFVNNHFFVFGKNSKQISFNKNIVTTENKKTFMQKMEQIRINNNLKKLNNGNMNSNISNNCNNSSNSNVNTIQNLAQSSREIEDFNENKTRKKISILDISQNLLTCGCDTQDNNQCDNENLNIGNIYAYDTYIRENKHEYSYIDHLDFEQNTFKAYSPLAVNEKFRKLQKKLVKQKTGKINYWDEVNNVEDFFMQTEHNEGERLKTETERQLNK